MSLGFIKPFQQKSTKRELTTLFGLPLLPLTHVYHAFENIALTLLRCSNSFEEFLQYVSIIYLQGKNFRPTSWNHFATIRFTDRTNNALEGNHRSINAYVLFYIFINCYLLGSFSYRILMFLLSIFFFK